MTNSGADVVVMIHGLCCTGDVWRNFRGRFEAGGWRVSTPTLRPDCRVVCDPPPALTRLGLGDYASDLEREISRIVRDTGHAPALIGHSMGGLLAQMLCARAPVRAAVLLAPVPAGRSSVVVRSLWALRDLLRPASRHEPFRIGRRAAFHRLFNRATPAVREREWKALVYESPRVARELAVDRPQADPRAVSVPTLTIGGGKDRFVPPRVARRVAARYAPGGGLYREYAGRGHWLLDEPGWEEVASLCVEFVSAAVAPRAEP